MEKLGVWWLLLILVVFALAGSLLLAPTASLQAQETATTTSIEAAGSASFPGCPEGTVRLLYGRNSVSCLNAAGNSLDTLTTTQYGEAVSAANPGQCNLFVFDFTECIWKPVLIAISEALIGFTTWILEWIGILFDTFISWTVIDYRGTLEMLNMLEPINKIWAVFRDIGNILIIGMFVFVALTTILSLPNYDTRRLVAKILIVAVLINFSLFFTKFTIDVSNFVARQFYTYLSLSSQTVEETDEATGTTKIKPVGIALAFVDKVKVVGVFNNDLATFDAVSIITYTIGAVIFMGFVAAIFVYGAFLLATRAILLLFLLLTSSLAFASMLLPSTLSKQMWDKWWRSLLNVAVFAPLIMLFLFLTITILNSTSGEGSLVKFVTNPATAGSGTMIVLFIFIFASGLLFISMKLASSFATKISGFDYAAALPGLGAVGAAAGGSWLGRNIVGRGTARFAEIQAERATRLTGEGKHIQAGLANAMSGGFGRVGKASFNAMNTGVGKQIAGIAGGEKGLIGGVLKTATTAGKGGFIEQEKKTVEKQQKRAEKLVPTKEQQQQIRDESLRNAPPAQRHNLQSAIQGEQAIDAQKKALAKVQEGEVQEKDKQIARIAAKATANPSDPRAQQVLEGRVAQKQAIIDQHRRQNEQMEQEVSRAADVRREAERAIIPKEALQSREENIADIAHRRIANVPWRILTGQTAEKDEVAQRVRKITTESTKKKQEKERAEAYFGAPPTPPPTTP